MKDPLPPKKKGGLHIQQTKTGGGKSKQNWHLIVKSWYYERPLSSPPPKKKIGCCIFSKQRLVGKNENIIDILLLNLDIMKDANHQKKTHKKTREGAACSANKDCWGETTQNRHLYLLLSKSWYYEIPLKKGGGLYIQKTKTSGKKPQWNQTQYFM